jgi:hypothetical protein
VVVGAGGCCPQGSPPHAAPRQSLPTVVRPATPGLSTINNNATSPQVALAQGAHSLPQRNHDGHHSSLRIASCMCCTSCLVVNSSCGNLIFSGLRFQRSGGPNDRGVAEEYPVSADLSCRVDSTFACEFSNPYLANIQFFGVLLAGIDLHNSSRKRVRDAKIETPANRFMTSFQVAYAPAASASSMASIVKGVSHASRLPSHHCTSVGSSYPRQSLRISWIALYASTGFVDSSEYPKK